MKFWLIVFLFNYNGDFAGKIVQPYPNKAACEQQLRATAGEPRLRMVCVSNDHYTGRKQDPGVPMD